MSTRVCCTVCGCCIFVSPHRRCGSSHGSFCSLQCTTIDLVGLGYHSLLSLGILCSLPFDTSCVLNRAPNLRVQFAVVENTCFDFRQTNARFNLVLMGQHGFHLKCLMLTGTCSPTLAVLLHSLFRRPRGVRIYRHALSTIPLDRSLLSLLPLSLG